VIFCRTNIQQIQAETPIFTIQNNSIFYISDSYGFEYQKTAQNRRTVRGARCGGDEGEKRRKKPTPNPPLRPGQALRGGDPSDATFAKISL